MADRLPEVTNVILVSLLLVSPGVAAFVVSF